MTSEDPLTEKISPAKSIDELQKVIAGLKPDPDPSGDAVGPATSIGDLAKTIAALKAEKSPPEEAGGPAKSIDELTKKIAALKASQTPADDAASVDPATIGKLIDDKVADAVKAALEPALHDKLSAVEARMNAKFDTLAEMIRELHDSFEKIQTSTAEIASALPKGD